MSRSLREVMMGLVEVIIAIGILYIMWSYVSSGTDEVAMNQQVDWFIKLRSQIGSVCDMVKVNPNIPQYSRKDYIVLYPYYDIRVYNRTQDMPDAVKSVCRGDKCACLVKTEKTLSWGASIACITGDLVCEYNHRKIDGVLTCFNMNELGCDKLLYFEKNVTGPIRNINKNDIKKTCKYEGVVTWDRKAFFYDKLSDYCEGEQRQR